MSEKLLDNVDSVTVIGYRVKIYNSDKKIWSMKTSALVSYADACNEAERIHKETGKSTRVVEYWEVSKSVKEFNKEK